jgi:5-methylcytosine-specific restriction endonuclease McrA
VSLRLPTSEYKALCLYVMQRDKWRCRSCGLRYSLAAHHVVFRSHQGPDTKENLCTLCTACHQGVHTDVKRGVFGLVILWDGPLPNADVSNGIRFQRRLDWKPR